MFIRETLPLPTEGFKFYYHKRSLEKLKEELLKQIDTYKKNAIGNIQKEAMVPAMWDIAQLIDLKAQIGILEKAED